ncbi:MAG: TonB family protein [Proteobacteria bacterium]|nr:TonB family protein [Pseudomonadota bacterium]
MQPNDWKLPLNIAIGIHLMLLLAALYLPGLFKAKPKFADIYTVSLINIAEPALAPPSAKPQAPSPAKVQESAPPPPPVPAVPKVNKKVAPIADIPEKVEPAPTPAPQKAISLKPLKKKIVKNLKEQEIPVKKNDQDLKKVQKLAEALREEAVLIERARLAQEALEQERRVLTQSNKGRIAQNTESSVGPQSNTPAPAVSGSSTNLLESQYQAAIASRLQQFWSLPEHLQKDPNLTAIVAITIRIDGDIANMVFESKSGDRIFDQFVSNTIEAAKPLPPIPPALKKQRYDIGFRFKPGSIQ